MWFIDKKDPLEITVEISQTKGKLNSMFLFPILSREFSRNISYEVNAALVFWSIHKNWYVHRDKDGQIKCSKKDKNIGFNQCKLFCYRF